MATQPKIPPDETLDILRRLESALAVITNRLDKIDGRLDKLELNQRTQGEALAELRGKVSALPTIWQIVPAMLAINAGIMALGFALAGMLRHG
jgi:hypothetical protein